MDKTTKKLFDLATAVRQNAYAPLSKFKVGAAVVTAEGKFYVGCNVESAAYTITTHAEMNAIDTAVANGDRNFIKILIITNSPKPIFPCALCRQKIMEFSEEAEVIATIPSGEMRTMKIKELYPESFTLKDI
jgi:cytidine deaminase